MSENEQTGKRKVGDIVICPYCGIKFKFDGDMVVQACPHCWKPINLKEEKSDE